MSVVFRVIIAIFLFSPFTSMAWGVLGHRIIGEVAESHLTPKAKKEIKKILGNESLAMVSNWGDFIKSDSSFDYLDKWHYINLAPNLAEKAFMDSLARDTSSNAYNAINFLTKELKNKGLADSLKVRYLKLLVHFVGDIHQPLHVGRAEDRGGNRIRVEWFRDNVNLHQVWDEKLVNFQQLSYTEYTKAINHSRKEQRSYWQNQPLQSWLYESYLIANKIYSDIKPEQKLSYRYNYDYIATVNDQLLKGGVRLAGLLNDIFG